MKDCVCSLIKEEEINSLARFKEIKSQFKQLTENGSLSEIPVSKPFYIGYGIEGDEHKWFADKWYKCKKCGAIWEFIFPDFPSQGSVKNSSGGYDIVNRVNPNVASDPNPNAGAYRLTKVDPNDLPDNTTGTPTNLSPDEILKIKEERIKMYGKKEVGGNTKIKNK